MQVPFLFFLSPIYNSCSPKKIVIFYKNTYKKKAFLLALSESSDDRFGKNAFFFDCYLV